MAFVDLVGFEPTSCMINSSPHIVPQRVAKLFMDVVCYEILRQLEIPKLIQDSVRANYIFFDKTYFNTGIAHTAGLKTYSSHMFNLLIQQQFSHPCQSAVVPHWLKALCDKLILIPLKYVFTAPNNHDPSAVILSDTSCYQYFKSAHGSQALELDFVVLFTDTI